MLVIRTFAENKAALFVEFCDWKLDEYFSTVCLGASNAFINHDSQEISLANGLEKPLVQCGNKLSNLLKSFSITLSLPVDVAVSYH